MAKIEECIYHCEKLLNLLYEEYESIGNGMQGDLEDAYKSILKKEIDEMCRMLTMFKRLLYR